MTNPLVIKSSYGSIDHLTNEKNKSRYVCTGRRNMSKLMKLMIAIAIIAVMAVPLGVSIVKANAIPTFNIVSVVPDEQVTIQTYDFPENMDFDVLMGEYGSMGMNGTSITTQNSGKGGTFTATYKIPEELKGKETLSIRLENVESGYYAYNWFDNRDFEKVVEEVNNSGTPEVTTIELSHPFFAITDVVMDKSVTVKGSGFPKNEEFDVTFGAYGSYGMSGVKVTTQKTGDKGEFKATYEVPKEFAGEYMISINMENPDTGYYAFNYFYNADYASPVETTVSSAPTTAATPVKEETSTSGYTGYPFFNINKVEKDTSFALKAENLPIGDEFDVMVANFNGGDAVKAGTIDASKLAVVEQTFMIPEELKGVSQISVRLTSAKSGYFAYNFFFNDTFPVVPTVAVTEAPAVTTAPAVTVTTEPTKVPIIATVTPMPTAKP